MKAPIPPRSARSPLARLRLPFDTPSRVVRLDRMTSLTAAVLAALYGAPSHAADGGSAVNAGAIANTSAIASFNPIAGLSAAAAAAALASNGTAAAPGAVVSPGTVATPGTIATAGTVAAANVAAAAGAAANGASIADTAGIQEVMVTATRREANAQDLPLSITAITGAQLQSEGIHDMGALAQSVAGVNYTDKGAFGGVNGSTLIIRGLNSEQTAGQLALATPVVPPVATYVDDTPLYFNLQLQDLERVEILRGPQGTLYGSGSLGGTIRFVQNPPDPSGFDAYAEVGMSDTAHTHAPNEEAQGVLNIPLSDTFAVRLNANASYQAGFINQPNLYALDSSGAPISAQPGNVFSPPVKYAQDGTNSTEVRGARLSALWKPNETFHAQLSYYFQQETSDGFPYAATNPAAYNAWISPATQPRGTFTNPPLATQLYNSPVPAGVDALSNADNSLEIAQDKVGLGALTMVYDMGFATLTSSTSYADHINRSSDDLTALYTNFSFYQSLYGQNPRSFVQGHDEFDDRPFAQELRLTSSPGGPLDWVAGLFYRDEKTNIQEHEFYPGYLNFYNGCAPLYGQSSADGITPSYCGVGETAYTPGATNYVDGIPIIKDQAYIGDFETDFKDMAAFGDVTWHVTSAWSVTGGTRLFKQTVSQAQQTGLLFDGGAFFGSQPPIANMSLSDSWTRALWKLNTAYKLGKHNMIYATWSQGFRRGGVNALPAAEPGVGYVTPAALTKLQPDTADNYEVGLKGTFAGRLQYSTAIYDIQWHNVQEGVQLTPLVLPASLNIGDAFSRGAEIELNALVTDNFSTQVDYTYDQTKLTAINPLFVYPNVSAPPPALGSPLPGTPKESLAVTLEYAHVHVAGGELRYDITAHYQSALLPALSATIPSVPGYTMFDTRLSFVRSHWTTMIYVDNVTNILGIQSYSDPALYGNRYQAIVSTPRTVGFTIGYSFDEL